MTNDSERINLLNIMVTKPEIVWMLAFMGAVCVIGVVDYLRCFFEKKRNTIRWVVLIISLFVSIILSPIIPSFFTVIVILWLLILALATIGKKHIIDGIGNLMDKITGSTNTGKGGE